jgi:hypothetical protein
VLTHCFLAVLVFAGVEFTKILVPQIILLSQNFALVVLSCILKLPQWFMQQLLMDGN